MKRELSLLKDLPIITAKLIINQLQLDDLDCLYGLMSLTAIQEFIPERFRTKEELKQTLEWLISNYSMKKNEIIRITLGIRSKEGKKLIGWISYGPLPYNESLKEIAYAIDPAYWNLGYATAAGKAFLEWLFDNRTDCDMYAQVNPKNNRSIRVLGKLGMAKIKEDTMKKGRKTEDVWIYKLQRKIQNHTT